MEAILLRILASDILAPHISAMTDIRPKSTRPFPDFGKHSYNHHFADNAWKLSDFMPLRATAARGYVLPRLILIIFDFQIEIRQS